MAFAPGQGAGASGSASLDVIGSTRGSVLYRGAAGWAILTPGTSGWVLTSNGAGADPAYAATGAATWASVLGAGSTTSGQNPQITTGDLLGFGGATSSFTALKPSGTTLLCRLADDSAAAAFTAALGTFTSITSTATTTSTFAGIVKLGSGALPQGGLNNTNTSLLVSTDANEMFRFYAAGTSNPNTFYAFNARGTNASPTAVQNGDNLVQFYMGGYGGATNKYAAMAFITAACAGAPNDGAGTYTGRLYFSTANNSVSPINQWSIEAAGHWQGNNAVVVGWTASSSDPTAALDTGLSRDAAGVVDFGTGAQGSKAGSWKATNGTLTGILSSTGTGITSFSGPVKTGDGSIPGVLNNTNTSFLVSTDANAMPRFYASGAGNPAVYYILNSRGTTGSPTAVSNGDTISYTYAAGYLGPTSGYAEHAEIGYAVAAAPNDGAATCSGRIYFATSNATGSAAKRWSIEAAGHFQGIALANIGWVSSTDPTAALDTNLSRDAAGVIDFGTGAQGSKAGSWKATTGSLLGKLALYNNVTTAGWGVPAIYGSGTTAAATGQTTSAAAYTVGAADGTFLIYCNILVTTSTTHSFTAEVAYTDEGNTARVLTLSYTLIAGGSIGTLVINANGTVPYEYLPICIRAKASTSITVRTSAGGTYTAVAYNINAAITQIS